MDKSNRIIIIGNGEIDDYNIFKRIIKTNDLIISVNGGTNHLKKVSLKPHYIIGDLDSLKHGKYTKTCKILKFPVNKDKTDTELALDFALKNKPNKIILIGMSSQLRIDHTMNNIFLMERLANANINTTLIINKFTKIMIVKEKIKILKKEGKTVSLIPLSYKVQHITTKGLKYQLNDESLLRYKTRGISNIIIKKDAIITVKKGSLLVIQTKTIK